MLPPALSGVALGPETHVRVASIEGHDIFEHQDLDVQDVMRETCDTTMRAFESSLMNAFDPWVAQHTEAAFHTISLFDYLGVLIGRQSAECTSTQTNPLVSVMIPTPLDWVHCTEPAPRHLHSLRRRASSF